MLFTRSDKHWGLLHFERLGILIPGITLCVFFLAAVSANFISTQTAHTHTRDALAGLLRDRITFIQGAAEEFVEIGLNSRLQQLISSLASERDLISIHIVDANDRVLASSHLADVGVPWASLQNNFQPHLIESVRRNHRLENFHAVQQQYMETYASLCASNHAEKLRVQDCGFIVYRVDIKPHLQAATLALRDKSLYYLLGMAAVVLVSLGLIHVLVARRTSRIMAVLMKFSGGDRSARIKVERKDEISELGASINNLLEEIVEDEKEIRDGHARLHALFDNVIDGVIVINEQGMIESANPAAKQVFGYEPEEIIGRNVNMLMPEPVSSEHDGYLARYCKTGVGKTIGVGRHVEAMHKSGHIFPAELSVSEMIVHGDRLFTGIVRDISERVEMNRKMQQAYEELRKAHQELEETARTDRLTGLYNRGHFDTTLLTETMRATRHRMPLSLMLLDADYFKRFNDHYGHLEGDRCLQQIAGILQQSFQRGGEMVARYGGEEFAVVLPHCDERDAMNRADALLKAVRDEAIPHEKSGVAGHVTISIGVATHYPRSKQPILPDDLVKAADEMLYNAKAAGRNQAVYSVFESAADGARSPVSPVKSSSGTPSK